MIAYALYIMHKHISRREDPFLHLVLLSVCAITTVGSPSFEYVGYVPAQQKCTEKLDK